MKSIVVKFVADTKQFKTGANEVVRIIKNVKKGVISTDKSINKLTRDLNKSATSMGKFATKADGASRAINNLNKKAKPVKNTFERIKDELSNTAKNVPGLNRLTNIFPAISGTALATVGAIAGVGYAIGKAVAVSARMENSITAFKVLTGSVEQAKNIMSELNTFAAKTPLALNDIADAGQTLLSGGVAASNLTETLRKLGDVGQITGNRLGDLASFVAKNMKTGILQGEDLNSLFDRKLGPVVEQMSKQMGVNVQQLKKLAGQGKVSFSVFEQALDTVTSKGGQFFGGLNEASKTMTGIMSTMADNVRSVGLAFTGVLAPKGAITLWTELKSIVNNLLSGLQSFVARHSSDLQAIGATLGIIIREIFDIIGYLLKPLMIGLSFALKVIGLIAKIFVSLVSGIRTFSNFLSELISGIFKMLFSTEETTSKIVGAIRKIVDFIGNFINKIKVLLFLIQEFAIIIGNNIEKQFESIGNRIRGFFGLSPETPELKKEINVTGSQSSATPVIQPNGNTSTTNNKSINDNRKQTTINNVNQTILIQSSSEAEKQIRSGNMTGTPQLAFQ